MFGNLQIEFPSCHFPLGIINYPRSTAFLNRLQSGCNIKTERTEKLDIFLNPPGHPSVYMYCECVCVHIILQASSAQVAQSQVSLQRSVSAAGSGSARGVLSNFAQASQLALPGTIMGMTSKHCSTSSSRSQHDSRHQLYGIPGK